MLLMFGALLVFLAVGAAFNLAFGEGYPVGPHLPGVVVILAVLLVFGSGSLWFSYWLFRAARAALRGGSAGR